MSVVNRFGIILTSRHMHSFCEGVDNGGNDVYTRSFFDLGKGRLEVICLSLDLLPETTFFHRFLGLVE